MTDTTWRTQLAVHHKAFELTPAARLRLCREELSLPDNDSDLEEKVPA